MTVVYNTNHTHNPNAYLTLAAQRAAEALFEGDNVVLADNRALVPLATAGEHAIPAELDGAPHEGMAEAVMAAHRAMPSYAEIRRATLLDIPGNALRPLLEPYVAAAPLDEAAYPRRYPDVAEAVATRRINSAREHYVSAGYFEGRQG